MLLPRILCLHGGGVNAAIFRAQFRSFLNHEKLKNRFRFVFVDAPFFCDEGVGVHPVYSDWGPFRRWGRWLDSHPEIDPAACVHEIEYAIKQGMDADEGTGPWVGTLGFSQGAKMATSLLYQQQIEEKDGPWRFGVIFAGRAPFIALNEEAETFPWMQSAAGLPGGANLDSIQDRPEMKLRIPTVHIHGMKDEGLHLHQRCVDDYCAPLTTTLVEWDGPHRIPIKKADVDKVVDAITSVADEYAI